MNRLAPNCAMNFFSVSCVQGQSDGGYIIFQNVDEVALTQNNIMSEGPLSERTHEPPTTK